MEETHRGSFDPAAGLCASPAWSIYQKVTAFIIQTWHHVTPLLGPHDTGCGAKQEGGYQP